MSRDLKEIPDINGIIIAYAPFSYDPQKRLFGIEAVRENSSVQVHELTNDYQIPSQDPQLGWYDKAIKNGAYWSEPFYNSKTKQHHVLYVRPFYQGSKNPAGVIVITYVLDKIIDRVRAIEIGKTGYAAILSSNQTFLYHPLEHYVKDHVRLSDITREKNNSALKEIADQMKKNEGGFGSYTDSFAKVTHWIAYYPIPSVKWTLAVLFSDESLDLPMSDMHKQNIWILITLVLTLLLLSMILSHLEIITLNHIKKWSVLTSILFAGALLIFWILITRVSYQPRSDILVVRDRTAVDKYIEFLQLDAKQRNEKKPIVSLAGIILQTLLFPDSNTISVSGYVWQKIKKESDQDAARIKEGLRFPDAIKAEFREVLRKESAGAAENNELIIGWNIEASFLQKHRYSWFPFDRVHVDIIIASLDFENNVVLVPDFSGYQSLDIDPLPGITRISIPGFDLERSFFSFSTLPADDEVGLEALKKVTEKVRLHYNIILDRKLTNPFIIFFLPLLVILFSIYAVFLIAFRNSNIKIDVFKALSAYTALFFSVVILHQTLRSQYQAGELLYIEYFFFFTYVTLLLLVLHALMLRVSHFSHFINTKATPYLRVLFWPVQFAVWFIVTMIVFYAMR